LEKVLDFVLEEVAEVVVVVHIWKVFDLAFLDYVMAFCLAFGELLIDLAGSDG